MDRLAAWALRLIVVLNVLATVVAFGESYAGLYQWAHHHTIVGFWAGVWPLMIDTIILVGEAALFVSHHFQWKTSHKVWAWMVTMTALGVSVAANTGHVNSTDWLSRFTAALPPAAVAFCMTVGLGVMKRYYANKKARPETVSRPAERTHIGTAPAFSNPSLTTEMRPVSRTETPKVERPAPVIPDPTESPEATRIQPGFKIIPGKSYTMPKDPRDLGNDLMRIRVRDMYDVDPDIVPNAIAKALGISWATADKYLKETKEARGLEL